MDISNISEEVKEAAIHILENFRPLFSNPIAEGEIEVVKNTYFDIWVSVANIEHTQSFHNVDRYVYGNLYEIAFAIGWLQTMENEHRERGLIQTDPWESCL